MGNLIAFSINWRTLGTLPSTSRHATGP